MDEIPTLGEAGRRLLAFWEKQRQEGAYNRSFSSTRMFDIAADLSKTEVASVLGVLVSKGLIDQLIRVESAAQGGIKDFKSIEDIPLQIEDWRRGNVMVEVKPEDLSVYYKLHE